MYTRSRQSQGNYPNARNQGNQGNQGQFNNPNYNQQQGNYQQSPANQQQGGFKGGNAQNPQFNQQQKPQQQSNMQNSPARPMQQQMKPQMGQQQQQQQQQKMQQQQQGNQTPQQPQRLKPILKQSTPSQQTPGQNQQQPQQPTGQQQQQTPSQQSQPQQQVQNQQQQSNANAQGVITPQNAELKNENQENADVEMQEGTQPRWKRKVPGFKVNKKLKRLRMNQRLRKTLQPKNAIMVLNEMKAGVQFTFPENQGNMQNALYVVHAELDGKTYVGQGLSKPLARQNAAENALKALLLEKMTAASMKVRMDAESDGQSQTAESVKDENNDENQSAMETNADESEDIPWGSLASFAMYKLFLEWHNQGTSVPVPRPGLPPPAKAIKKDPTKPPVQKELPPNATSIHPVMLLNQMRPGLTYVELSRQGNPPNIMFTLAVEVDGVEYSGTAKNKKDAKKTAAKSALLALYNLVYPDEVKTDGSEDVQMS